MKKISMIVVMVLLVSVPVVYGAILKENELKKGKIVVTEVSPEECGRFAKTKYHCYPEGRNVWSVELPSPEGTSGIGEYCDKFGGEITTLGHGCTIGGSKENWWFRDITSEYFDKYRDISKEYGRESVSFCRDLNDDSTVTTCLNGQQSKCSTELLKIGVRCSEKFFNSGIEEGSAKEEKIREAFLPEYLRCSDDECRDNVKRKCNTVGCDKSLLTKSADAITSEEIYTQKVEEFTSCRDNEDIETCKNDVIDVGCVNDCDQKLLEAMIDSKINTKTKQFVDSITNCNVGDNTCLGKVGESCEKEALCDTKKIESMIQERASTRTPVTYTNRNGETVKIESIPENYRNMAKRAFEECGALADDASSRCFEEHLRKDCTGGDDTCKENVRKAYVSISAAETAAEDCSKAKDTKACMVAQRKECKDNPNICDLSVYEDSISGAKERAAEDLVSAAVDKCKADYLCYEGELKRCVEFAGKESCATAYATLAKITSGGSILGRKIFNYLFGEGSYDTIMKWTSAYTPSPALTELTFGKWDGFNDWRERVDRKFAKLAGVDYITSKVCNVDVKKEMTGTALIETISGEIVFLGSIQAEKDPNKVPILCDINATCPGDLECREDRLCYKQGSKDYEEGHFYKITWNVQAPVTGRNQITVGKGREEYDVNYNTDVAFNVQVQGDNDVWLYDRKRAAKNKVIVLREGARDGDAYVTYSPNNYNKVCIIFGQKPENRWGKEVSRLCTDIVDTTAGSIEWEESGKTGSRGSVGVSSGNVERNQI